MAKIDQLERQHAILLEIIQYYLARHEAVSARTISKISQLALSPTTIRNLMEDLSSDGFLTTEGVSRGRIPTQKAFTIYVSELRQYHPPQEEAPVPPNWAEEEENSTLAEVLDKFGVALAEQTGFIIAALLPEKDAYPLDWVRLVSIHPDRLMVAVQSVFGDLWAKVLHTPTLFPEQVLRDIEKYVCSTYHNDPMEKVRAEIMAGHPMAFLEDMPSLGAAFRLLRRAFDWEKEPRWQVWGRENLYQIPEYQPPEQAVLLHKALEDAQFLPTALAGAREVEGGQISIGTETRVAGLETSAVVAFPFGLNHWQAKLAVVGPMRMDYGLVISLAGQTAAALTQTLERLGARASPCA